MESQPRNVLFRDALAKDLDTEIAECGGAIHLAERIALANQGRDPKLFRVDRRKLADLAAARPVKITFFELDAIDAYLSQRGRGLLTLLQKRSILKPLVQSGRIGFLVGSKPHDSNTVLSRWDVLSLSNIQRSLDRHMTGVRFTIEDVLLRSAVATPERSFASERWFQLIQGSEPTTLITFGSPRANNAAECMLSAMFGFPAFVPADPASGSIPPFLFVSSQRLQSASCMAYHDPRVGNSMPGEKLRSQYVGVKVQNETFGLERTGEYTKEYGLLAIQKRRSQIWVVIAGMTGPATYAAEHVFEELAVELPSAGPATNSAVMWGVVETRVARRPGRMGDDREVVSQGLLGDLKLWPHR